MNGRLQDINVVRGQICHRDSASRRQHYRRLVFRVGFAADIALGFECAEYLRSHHLVEFGVLRESRWRLGPPGVDEIGA